MPKITRALYEPLDEKWWKATAEAADKERLARCQEIDDAWAYYKGEQPLPLKVRPRDPNYNVILDLCGQAVDTMVSFLSVPELEVEGGTVETPDAHGLTAKTKSPDQTTLDDLLEANRFPILMHELLLAGCVAGHTFVKLIADELPATAETIRLELIDPRLVTVFWMGSKAVWYRLKWKVDAEETRTQDIVPNWLLTPDTGDDPSIASAPAEDWTIIEYSEKSAQRVAEVTRDPWPYPFAPMVDWPNMLLPFEFYGRSDIPLVRRRTNDAANFVASNVQKIIYHHAGPQTVVTGGELPDDVEGGPGTVIEISEENAKVYNLEMASDLSSSMAQGLMLRGAFFESVKVVDRASVKDKLGVLTNFAVRMLYGAQVDAASLKQLLYGEGLRTAWQNMLALINVVVKVNDEWPDTLPQDRAALVQSVAVEDGMGIVSERTLLTELGHDPAEEAARKATETNNTQDVAADVLRRMGQRNLLGAGNGNGGLLGG